jgi:UDP-perosamine 4-acetyltransferase
MNLGRAVRSGLIAKALSTEASTLPYPANGRSEQQSGSVNIESASSFEPESVGAGPRPWDAHMDSKAAPSAPRGSLAWRVLAKSARMLRAMQIPHFDKLETHARQLMEAGPGGLAARFKSRRLAATDTALQRQSKSDDAMSPRDRRIIIVGGGGHAMVVTDVLRATGWEPAGILDPNPAHDTVQGVPVLGGDELSQSLFEQGYRNAFVAIGRNDLRRRLGMRLRGIGFEIVTAVHPSAVVSPSAMIGQGVVVMPLAVVNAGARIGDFAIVNTGAIVEHDCAIGEAAHVAPRSAMGGNVTIGEEVLFGVGAVARPLSVIGARTVVGVGAVVIGEIPSDRTVTGSPARVHDKASRR